MKQKFNKENVMRSLYRALVFTFTILVVELFINYFDETDLNIPEIILKKSLFFAIMFIFFIFTNKSNDKTWSNSSIKKSL
jgi:hypothetical protein